jgi:hypothetical protein
MHLRTPTFCTDLNALQSSFELFAGQSHEDFIKVTADANYVFSSLLSLVSF